MPFTENCKVERERERARERGKKESWEREKTYSEHDMLFRNIEETHGSINGINYTTS